MKLLLLMRPSQLWLPTECVHTWKIPLEDDLWQRQGSLSGVGFNQQLFS